MPNNVSQEDYIKLLENALTDIVDGLSVIDLMDMTGFDEDHCQKIRDLYQSINNK